MAQELYTFSPADLVTSQSSSCTDPHSFAGVLVMRTLWIFILAAGFAIPVSAQPAVRDTTCTADFAVMEPAVRGGHPGLHELTDERRAAFESLTDSVRIEALRVADEAACLTLLRRWIKWFGDNHLQLAEATPVRTSSAAATIHADSLDAPSLRFPDDSTAVLRLPSFGRDQKDVVDRLLVTHRARLFSTPFLIVDVRGNGGGWTAVYDSVLPLVYTGPIRVDGMDVYASATNIALARDMIESGRAPAAMLEQARAVLARMEATPDRFVPFSEEREIRLDTVHPVPRAVALLVDRRCASSCEQFVLDSRQSRKVTVLGTRSTRGMLDYGNARRVPLPSGRRFFMPSIRSRRLPRNSLDRTGIAPAVLIPLDETDPMAFAIRYLRGARP